MKRITFLFILLFSILLTANLFAQNHKMSLDDPKYEEVEQNLLEGLKSENDGLIFSSAFALGEMKSEMAINPLIKLLRKTDDDNLKIMAALSLTKIGTERSKFMVRRVGEFIDNPKVSHFCERFLAVKQVEISDKDRKLVTKIFEKKEKKK